MTVQTHECPRKGCKRQVSNSLYACLTDWEDLTPETQRAIRSTARLSVLATQRRNAFEMARQDWEDADEQAERNAN